MEDLKTFASNFGELTLLVTGRAPPAAGRGRIRQDILSGEVIGCAIQRGALRPRTDTVEAGADAARGRVRFRHRPGRGSPMDAAKAIVAG